MVVNFLIVDSATTMIANYLLLFYSSTENETKYKGKGESGEKKLVRTLVCKYLTLFNLHILS